MKTSLLSLLVVAGLAHATPPVLSLTQAALSKIDPEIKPDHYNIARTDLDGDGKEDVLALMNGRSGYSGSGGATMFIFKGTSDGFDSLGSIKVVNAPIYLRRTSTKGLRDLLVTVRGGGATPGLSALAFDGKAYPASPGAAEAKLNDGDSVLFTEPAAPFEKSETLQGITFKASSPNSLPNTLTITPSGLEGDNTPINLEVAGLVKGMEVGDLNADGSPEIYIYLTAANKHGQVIAYSANKKKSLSQISLPELGELAKGYRGGDEFAVLEGILGRRFPIYPVDASKTEPTGKLRQIQYKLHAGEAGWLLKVDKVTEF